MNHFFSFLFQITVGSAAPSNTGSWKRGLDAGLLSLFFCEMAIKGTRKEEQ